MTLQTQPRKEILKGEENRILRRFSVESYIKNKARWHRAKCGLASALVLSKFSKGAFW